MGTQEDIPPSEQMSGEHLLTPVQLIEASRLSAEDFILLIIYKYIYNILLIMRVKI